MKIKAGLFILLILLVCAAACAQASLRTGNPYDTPTGTPLTAEGAYNPTSYQNANTTVETLYGATIEATVTTEAGYSLSSSPDWSSVQYSTPGSAITWNVTVYNEGNTPFTFNMTKSGINYHSSGSSNWDAYFTEGGPHESSINTLVPDNNTISFSFTISPSPVESESPDGSRGSVTLTTGTGFTTPGTPYYTGVNTLTYGDHTSAVEYNEVDILAPVMSLLRTQEVDAPMTYTGGRHDAVPGSVITYTIAYHNIGAASATDVIIVDKVPLNTEGYHINKTGPQTDVTIEASQGDASGWSVFYSTTTPTSFAYGNYDNWTPLGTITTIQSWELPSGATYVKWEKSPVPSTESRSLTWGVTIK